MKIEISKEEFEQAVPVARSKDDSIFNALESAMAQATDYVADEVLGEVGQGAFAAGKSSRLVWCVKALVCMVAFSDNLRGLDVVLTNTGFGVVSTQSLAPASRQRVDALYEQLRWHRLLKTYEVVGLLMGEPGWMDSRQRRVWVPTIVYHPQSAVLRGLLKEGDVDAWQQLRQKLNEGTLQLQKIVGFAQVEAFISLLPPSATPTAAQVYALMACERFLDAHAKGNRFAMRDEALQLLGIMDNSTEDFPQYFASKEYVAREQKGYENGKDSGVYIW